jgi:tRNA(Ile)-lysidine synthase
VSFRAGGERLRTEIGGPRRDLKELMRARNVLPWMRDRIPLLHAGRTLLAVADLWVNAECRAAKATGRRVRIDWVDAPSVKS